MKMLTLTLLAALLAGCTASLTPALGTGTVQTSGAGQSPVIPSGTSTGSSKSVKTMSVTPNNFVLTAGDAKDLLASVAYTDGTFDNNVAWSSSDSRIVDVNPTTGKLQAKAEGLASIVVTSLIDTTRSTLVTVTVRKGTVQEAFGTVTPAAATLGVHETVQLAAQIQLSDGSSSPNVTWGSSNQSVAIVSGNGLVTALAQGTATITATASGDATKKAICTISVK